MTTTNTDYIAGVLAELTKHPAMKFANDAIVLQAIRSGTNGYTGKENLNDWLTAKLLEAQNFALREVMLDEKHARAKNSSEAPAVYMAVGWNDCLSQLKSNALNKLNITL